MEKTFKSWLESNSSFDDVRGEVVSALSSLKTKDSSPVTEDTPIEMFDADSLMSRIKSLGSFSGLTRKSREEVMSSMASDKPGTVFDVIKKISDPLEMR